MKIMSEDEFEITLPNGYTIRMFEHEDKMVVGLVNPEGYYISDMKLMESEVEKIDDIISNYFRD